ncbi:MULTISPECIES: response regulator [Pseudonocardia]|uniref:Transcriptional regulatory protein LiaR n=2 Tax=Pseudonocardia TaxID=1847 RepID=A0A1Y2MJU8_PSEAH|nr:MULTISPECIES: response regulator transcription factor [Pseudonocardia]OSY35279.1 Transcriptional regulatory protein LiaR [Pseudonocardia autotrophica]TDN73282.1 LuxR family two component transcriptional regulator [Pseudonocardia autotrophica]BBG04018.1 DNA-binding response regulator [Pseudonocardia autotrophica]GEC27730.1 DNA-binding response regulator [Pseudonocardia saturnea]
MTRVLLADDEAVVRVGVRAVLASDPGIEVVAEAADGREAIELATAHRPDVAVLDVRMPGTDGLDAAAEITRRDLGCAILVLTTFADDDYLVRALADGAGGFVLKTGDPREIVDGVRAVAAGGAYLSPRMARRVLDLYARRRPRVCRASVDALTGRERAVLGLLGAGLSNAEIGRELHVVEGTVKVHVSAVLDRLGVRNRVQAAIVAHEHDLIPE